MSKYCYTDNGICDCAYTDSPTTNDSTMSESIDRQSRYNQRLEYIAHFERWLENEPPFVRLLKWHRWKKARPVLAEIENPTYDAR